MPIQDALLPMLLAGAVGLLVGAGFAAGLLKRPPKPRQPLDADAPAAPRRAAESAPQAPPPRDGPGEPLPSATQDAVRPASTARPMPAPAAAPAPAPAPAPVSSPVRPGPLAPAARAAPTRPCDVPAPPRVADLLVVDDSAVARAKLRRLFEAAGYRVQLAHDGVEALALLQQGRYALMLTDLEMPNMDGVALIDACRRNPQTEDLPILAITGHESLRTRFNDCPDIAGIHRKPWVDDLLLSHVAALVAAPVRPHAALTG